MFLVEFDNVRMVINEMELFQFIIDCSDKEVYGFTILGVLNLEGQTLHIMMDTSFKVFDRTNAFIGEFSSYKEALAFCQVNNRFDWQIK